MPFVSRRSILRAAASVAALPLAGPALAQEVYPSRPITMVVPIAAGGSLDIFTRLMGQFLTPDLGQQIVVENRVGAGGTIALQQVARARPDGYTMAVVTNSTFAISPHLYQLGYDNDASFSSVALLIDSPSFLCIHKSVPVKSLAELIAYLKANPDKVAAASAGVGFTSHLAAELFMSITGTKMLHVPYRGGALAAQAVMSNEAQVNFAETPTARQLVETGNVQLLGVTTRKRSPIYPEVPSLHEAGATGYESSTSFGLIGPAGMPKPVIDKMAGATTRFLSSPAALEQIRLNGYIPIPGDAAAFDKHKADNYKLWGDIIRSRGIKL